MKVMLAVLMFVSLTAVAQAKKRCGSQYWRYAAISDTVLR
jgi:hypothetical protein